MRKKNSMLNIIATLCASFSAILFNFITQRVIIHTLGIEYSGANGLFTNILNMLSIAELGIGSAIIFKLYKPIANNDHESIKSWMKFYKMCYRWIAFIILIIGIVLAPFIPIIVGKASIKENLIILYLLSLLDVVLSYTLTYKRSLLYAHQKNYIVNIIHTLYQMFMNLTQVLFLYLTKDYMLYVIIKIFYRLLENIIINIYVNKKYQYIKEKATDISKEEKKDVFERIKAIFVQKMSYQVNKGIDNVIITTMLGIAATGYYTNYHLVVVAIIRIIYWITSSMTASVGNLLTEKNYKKNYDIYRKMNLFNALLTGISTVGFLCAIQPFIKVWLGNKYILSTIVVFSFSFYIYSDSIRNSIRLFKDASGICKEDKHMYIIAIIINVVLSIALCKIMGIPGVILGTAISFIFLYMFSYPKYVFKTLFKRSTKDYHLENIKYLCFILISSVIAYGLCDLIKIKSRLICFVADAIIGTVITLVVFLIMFVKTREFNYYVELIKKVIKRTKKRRTS